MSDFNLHTPTDTPFTAAIDQAQALIIITPDDGGMRSYYLQAIKDLFHWLRNDNKGAWVVLGSCAEDEEPSANTVEAWARSAENPLGSFYGATPGKRGDFAEYVPVVMAYLGMVEVEVDGEKGGRVRAQP